jgi:NADH-quinone oxidoreductase subunit A
MHALLATLLAGYAPIVLVALIALTIGGAALLLSHILGPKRPTQAKEMAYECGVDPVQPGARERYSIHFYLVAILFILFDLETVFLIPWASSFQSIADPTVRAVLLVEVLAFVLVLGAGLVYVWKRRGLEWD